jgi:peptidylprolyl isomerase
MLFAALAALVMPAASAPAPSLDWRDVDPNNLVLIDTHYGEIAVELAPDFAPHHVERMRALIRAHFYDGKSFYRVIDGFVAQGGEGEGTASTKGLGRTAKTAQTWPLLKAEFDAPLTRTMTFTPLGSPDLFAPEVGHVGGFPVGRDAKDGRAWIVHCPGTFAFARDNANDTASTEFYIVIGEAPRRLDRNLTAFGRVIDGLQYVQKLNRGDPDVDNGVIADPKRRDPILRVRLAADLPMAARPHYQVMRSESAAFAAKKAAKLNPAPTFYHRKPPAILDLCILPVPVRRLPG